MKAIFSLRNRSGCHIDVPCYLDPQSFSVSLAKHTVNLMRDWMGLLLMNVLIRM